MPLSYAIAAAMTLAFAGLVNLVMLRPLSKVDMIEALKTVE
jgi:ABC-type antimicrobial peptide transport system permease subunit